MSALRRLHRMIHERLGLALSEHPHALERYLRERTRELGLSDPQDFVQRLAAEQLTSEDWTKLIGLATNPLTHFFRDESQLQSAMAFLEQARRDNPDRKLQIWSAGCSTGEEPYTLAILCRVHGFNSSILATDINPAAVSAGRRGVYAAWSLRHVEASVARHFFVPTTTGEFAVTQEVREQVQFTEHNLATGESPVPREWPAGWDLICAAMC